MTKLDQDPLEPTSSLAAQVITILKPLFRKSAVIGFFGLILTTSIATGYLLIGGILTLVESPAAPSAFFSVESDPGFYFSLSAVSLCVVQLTTSVILYNFVTGVQDERSHYVILMSYIGLGSGAAVLKYTLPQSIEFLIELF